jgi:hypothetical protein
MTMTKKIRIAVVTAFIAATVTATAVQASAQPQPTHAIAGPVTCC